MSAISEPAKAIEEQHDEENHEHHEQSFWRTYIFSTDHKVIGMQYGFCGLAFLSIFGIFGIFFGFFGIFQQD